MKRFELKKFALEKQKKLNKPQQDLSWYGLHLSTHLKIECVLSRVEYQGIYFLEEITKIMNKDLNWKMEKY